MADPSCAVAEACILKQEAARARSKDTQRLSLQRGYRSLGTPHTANRNRPPVQSDDFCLSASRFAFDKDPLLSCRGDELPTAGKGPMPVWVITLSSEVKVALSQISLLRPKHFSDVDVIRDRHTSSALLWGGDYSCSTSTCLVYPRANSAKQIIANS